jgi:hypothetical protein
MRAAHQLLDHPRILEDAVVLRLIGADQESALRANPQVLDRPELRPCGSPSPCGAGTPKTVSGRQFVGACGST